MPEPGAKMRYDERGIPVPPPVPTAESLSKPWCLQYLYYCRKTFPIITKQTTKTLVLKLCTGFRWSVVFSSSCNVFTSFLSRLTLSLSHIVSSFHPVVLAAVRGIVNLESSATSDLPKVSWIAENISHTSVSLRDPIRCYPMWSLLSVHSSNTKQASIISFEDLHL